MIRKSINPWFEYCTLVAVSLMLCSCAGGNRSGLLTARSEKIIWPPSPSRPRIEYLGTVSTPEDLDIGKGFLGFLKELAFGKEDDQMVLPMKAVRNRHGQLFVADTGKKVVHRFDISNGKYTPIKRNEEKEFVSPVGLATDRSGNIYVVDSDLAKVFVIPLNADHASELSLDADFIRPTGIAVDKDSGWVYVVDTGIHAVYIFDAEKGYVNKFGQRGAGDGEFNFPIYIWQNLDGRLLITDSLNFRVQVFDRLGQYISQFGEAGNATGDLARPKGVAADSFGHVYVTDSLFHNIQVFDESGVFLLDFGAQGTGPGQFWLPAGIFIAQDDTIYVADSYNRRIQVFRYIGID